MSSFAGNKNFRENDNKTKEIHEQIQGHGCLGRDKGAKEKQEAIRNMEKAFGEKGKEKSEEDEKSIRKLREKVGELTIERAMGRSLREYYESQHGWSRTREHYVFIHF